MTDGISTQNVYRRIRETRAYHEERLKLLFGIIYQEPDTAFQKWSNSVSRMGFEKAFKKQRRKTHILGKLNGTSIIGLYQTRDRQKTTHANAEFHQMARTWYRAVIEEEQVNRVSEQSNTASKDETSNPENQEALVKEKSQLQATRISQKTDGDETGAKL